MGGAERPARGLHTAHTGPAHAMPHMISTFIGYGAMHGSCRASNMGVSHMGPVHTLAHTWSVHVLCMARTGQPVHRQSAYAIRGTHDEQIGQCAIVPHKGSTCMLHGLLHASVEKLRPAQVRHASTRCTVCVWRCCGEHAPTACTYGMVVSTPVVWWLDGH